MAFAASASATQLTSPEDTVYTGAIEARAGEITFHGAGKYTCNESIAKGEVKSHGSSVTTEGPLTSWTVSECGTTHFTVLSKGSIQIHTEKESSNNNATVTITGTKVTTQATSLNMNCIYETTNTDLGVLTGSNAPEEHAVLVIDSVLIPRTGHNVFCGSSGELTATYVIESPSSLFID
jgi:hypothetical protein